MTEKYPDQDEDDQSDIQPAAEYSIEVIEKVHYVDNDEMLAAWLAYQEQRKEAAAAGKPDPVIPRFLAECLLKICNRTAYKYNFINYSFRDEMISDAIENCVRGINTFNPATSKYIFSYYTTAAWNAYVRRIQKEANESAIKGKMITEMDVDALATQEHDNGDFQTDLIEYMKQAEEYRMAHAARGKVEVKEKPMPVHENALVFDEE